MQALFSTQEDNDKQESDANKKAQVRKRLTEIIKFAIKEAINNVKNASKEDKEQCQNELKIARELYDESQAKHSKAQGKIKEARIKCDDTQKREKEAEQNATETVKDLEKTMLERILHHAFCTQKPGERQRISNLLQNPVSQKTLKDIDQLYALYAKTLILDTAQANKKRSKKMALYAQSLYNKQTACNTLAAHEVIVPAVNLTEVKTAASLIANLRSLKDNPGIRKDTSIINQTILAYRKFNNMMGKQ